ncbi:MAG: hypothetical protein WD250_02400, partial [Egibacteraceae bacterium]
MVLVAMSVAWACSANRHMEISHSEVMPGAAVTVSNVQWVARGEGHHPFHGNQVQVRWAAKDTSVLAEVNRDRAQVLATTPLTAEGTFTATVRVPEGIAAGDYLVYAVADVAAPNAAFGSRWGFHTAVMP